MHYKKLIFSIDSAEVKVQLVPFTVNAIQKRKWPCRLRDCVFFHYVLRKNLMRVSDNNWNRSLGELLSFLDSIFSLAYSDFRFTAKSIFLIVKTYQYDRFKWRVG